MHGERSGVWNLLTILHRGNRGTFRALLSDPLFWPELVKALIEICFNQLYNDEIDLLQSNKFEKFISSLGARGGIRSRSTLSKKRLLIIANRKAVQTILSSVLLSDLFHSSDEEASLSPV